MNRAHGKGQVLGALLSWKPFWLVYALCVILRVVVWGLDDRPVRWPFTLGASFILALIIAWPWHRRLTAER